MGERQTQEKKLLVAEVLKLRNDKSELIGKYKEEIDKLNKNNTNNIDQLKQLNAQQMQSKDRAHSMEIKSLNEEMKELTNSQSKYKEILMGKLLKIESLSNGFETMIKNANIGRLSEAECNKILDNIIHSIESLETEKEDGVGSVADETKDDGDESEDDLLNGIECRILWSLKEK